MPRRLAPESTIEASVLASPASASAEPRRARREHSDGPAVTLLTIYVAILWGIPSAQSIGILGSMGSPSLLWGFVCLGFWAWGRQSFFGKPARPLQPVRIAYLAFFVVVWVSFAFAQARGLPGDEGSPSTSALLRTLSWSGVILLANDGLTSKAQVVTLVRRVTLIGGLVALLGLAQFFTKAPIVDLVQLPGFTYNQDALGVMARSGFVRASGTAAHPLEFAVVLSGALPLAIGLACTRVRRGLIRTWWIPAAIGLACLLSSSRSAIVGFAVGLVGMLPVLSARGRGLMLAAVTVGLAFVYVMVPGMLGSLTGLFTGSDASTTSRTSGLAVAAQVWAQHPILGRGFGTFLPKYYILDNEFALLAIEVGILGLLAFLTLGAAALVQSQRARRVTTDADLAVVAHSLTAAVAACLVLFAFFDAFSFGMAAGTTALLIGMSGAIFNVATNGAGAAVAGDTKAPGRTDVVARQPATLAGHLVLGGGPGGRLRVNSGRGRRLAAVAMIGTMAVLACWFHILKAPDVYWTRAEFVIANRNINDKQAVLAPPDWDLIPFAVAVERVVNDGRAVTRLNSPEATLYGMGVSEGRRVYVYNTGNQWAPRFPGPVLVVETVSRSPEDALAVSREARADIAAAVSHLQDDIGVPGDLQMHTVSVLPAPTIAAIGSSRRGLLMALAAAGVALGLATAGAMLLLGRRTEGTSFRGNWTSVSATGG